MQEFEKDGTESPQLDSLLFERKHARELPTLGPEAADFLAGPPYHQLLIYIDNEKETISEQFSEPYRRYKPFLNTGVGIQKTTVKESKKEMQPKNATKDASHKCRATSALLITPPSLPPSHNHPNAALTTWL